MKIVSYIKGSFEELTERITWLSAKDAQKATVVVAVFTVVFSIAIFFTDEFFRKALRGFFNMF